MDERRSSGHRKRLLRLAASCLSVLALALVMALWATHFLSGPESAVTSLAQANSTLEQGHLFYNQGRLDEALMAYRHITEKLPGTPWQQAMAYNHMGQIYMVQGNVAKALECYEQAISQRQC